MAIYYARKSGNVNAADVWATTPTGTAAPVVFNVDDILVANSFTIILNVNIVVAEIRNDTTGGASNGGSFSLNSGTITATINGQSSSTTLLSINNSSDVYIIGNIYCGGLMTGNNVVISVSGIGAIYITGNLYQNGAGFCFWTNSKTIYITGNVMNNAAALGAIRLEGSAILNIVGNVIGGKLGGAAIYIWSGSPTIDITGIGIAGDNGGIIGYGNTGITSVITITRVKGNGFGPGSVGVSSQSAIASQQTTTVRVYEIEYGQLGQSPTSGPIELIGSTSNVAVFATRLGLPKTLIDLNNSTNLVPTSGNVRSGVSYNYGNNIGSCVVPNANSVVYGVPVDTTIGSGLLSPVAAWNALTNSIGTAGSIGERLKNVSTVSTVGKQLEGVL